MKYSNLLLATFLSSCLLSGCSSPTETASDDPYFIGDEDKGGLILGTGFQSYVIAEDLGRARHLAVRENGDIYVNLREANDQGGIAALRDTDGDGRADEIEYFSDFGGTGMAFYDGNLYASNDSTVFRYSFIGDNLLPENAEAPDTIVSGLPVQTSHAAKSFTFDDKGYLYVNIGAPSNACQEQDRTKGSPAMDPCPLLERHGGVWRFDASKIGQTQMEDGYRYSTGIRNAVALQFNPLDGHVYAVQHGRDMLNGLFPDMYTTEESVEQPAEEMFRLSDGADFGWPYCYFDGTQNKRLTAPEYGGDKQSSDRCEGTVAPVATFEAHMAPNDLLFYTGDQFPESYKGTALIAFHGSWNRAPLGQKGYFVAMQPFENGDPSGEYQILADGFAGVDKIEAPSDAKHRPTGLALAPDGTVIISDSVTGKIWRVFYKEDKTMASK